VSPTSPQLAETARDIRSSITRGADICRRYQLTDIANRAQCLIDTKFRTSTVVIVGEVKRGKSSLVNALIGYPDLLPVSVSTATSAPIRVFVDPSLPDDTPVSAALVRGDRRDSIDPGELDNWVTHEAVKRFEKLSKDSQEVQQLPSAAELHVPARSMTKSLIIDTPGVGGLDKHAINSALAEARNAGVLLMVCDASSPITSPEMEILRTAYDQVGSVIVALTKTDKNIRRWRAIEADNQRLIANHLGLDIPVVGVSSLRALDAQNLASEEKRREIEQRSGIAKLRDLITVHVNRPDDLGTKTALDITLSGLRQIASSNAQDLKLHENTSDAVRELEEERTRLEDYRAQTSEWEQLFQRDIALARNQASAELDHQLDELSQRWTQRINKEGMRILRTKPQVFTSQIEVELRQIMENSVSRMIDTIGQHAGQLLGGHPELMDEVNHQIMLSLAPPETHSHEVEKKTANLVDPSVLTMGLVGGSALTVVIPLAPLAAAAWIGVNMGYRAMRNGKQHLLTWLRETIATTRMATVRMFDTAITTGRTETMLKHRSRLRNELKELQTKLGEAQRIAQESENERRQTVARLKRNGEIIDQTIVELQNHREVLRVKSDRTLQQVAHTH